MSRIEVLEQVRTFTKQQWRSAATRAGLGDEWPWDSWRGGRPNTDPTPRHSVTVFPTDGDSWSPPFEIRTAQPSLRAELRTLRLHVDDDGVDVTFAPPEHTTPTRSTFGLGRLADGTLRVDVNWKQTATSSGGDWLYVEVVTLLCTLRNGDELSTSALARVEPDRVIDLRTILY